jgi:two-component system heavy metal sensor histidine kinase CusS
LNNARRSIKSRLTLFYSLATAALLTVSTLFLYFTTLHIMHHANEQFLSDEIDVLKNLLENKPDNLLDLKQEVSEPAYMETNSEYRYYIRILNKNKKTLIETPSFENVLHNADFFNHPVLFKKEHVHWTSKENRKYILMQSTANIGKTQEKITIQVALDISYQQYVINKYSQILIATLFVVTFIAILLGYWIASRGMRSLYHLTEITTQITATSLHQRINPKFWPKELNNLGLAFNQMLERIETAVLHLTQFAGDLAHELRTPINNLMGETEIALSSVRSVAEYERVLESNLEELQRISQLIENILFLAHTENPKLALKKESTHIANEIRLIIDFYQAIMDEKRITITQTGDAIVSVNLLMFRRALSNILSNALKYTPTDGTIHFNIKTLDHTIKITVRDNGMGIASEHLPYIFHRFYRVDSARARAAGGIGLGLAIVKSIIDLHHGSVYVESELEKGTTFTICLPIGQK